MRYDVTIGIPVYNSEAYIRRAMESAMAQTYCSVELLIVDDGSIDDSLCVIESILKESERAENVRVISHRNNMGVSATRNEIINKAEGEYLFFMDSDDEIANFTISLLMDNARRYDAEMVFGSYEKIEIDGQRKVYKYPSVQFLEREQLARFAYRKYAGIQASACNYLIKTSLLRDNNLCFIDANFWEDFVFTFELVTYVSRAVLLPDITYSYYCREGSLSHYQKRLNIPKAEVLNNVRAINHLKDSSCVYKDKDYFPNRCLAIVLTDFYISCNVIKKRKNIVPAISNKEIRSFMRHPALLSQIVHFKQSRFKNLIFFVVSASPPFVCVFFIWLLGKIKSLI